MVGSSRWLRAYQADWLTGGLHVIVLGAAAQVNSRAIWPYALAAAAVISFFAWIGNFSRFRQIRDLPVSRIASAPQGYVGLSGRCVALPAERVTSPLQHQPCCWYRYRIEERDRSGWRTRDEGVSTSTFFIADPSGSCLVAPDGAEVLYPHKKRWTDDGTRYTEWLLLPGSDLYALGAFRSSSGTRAAADKRREVSTVLADWKAEKRAILARFDHDRDGELDLREWEAARQAAGAEVDRREAESVAAGPMHTLSKPEDGRVFLLAAGPPHRLSRRFALWSALHLTGFLAALIASFVLFATGTAQG